MFPINSGVQTGASTWQNGKLLVRRINVAGLPELYAGHEVALHSLTHPHLENLILHTAQTQRLLVFR
ncbi:MAG: hypothetical protein LBC57_04130 [Treponema sp.]|nr:hypothetical protein [Treponema sp.]